MKNAPKMKVSFLFENASQAEILKTAICSWGACERKKKGETKW